MATQTTRQQPKSSLAPPPVAGVASLLLPGLGQILARQIYRGLFLFGSLATIIGLLAWRVYKLSRYQTGPIDRLAKALELDSIFMILMLIGVAALWLWIAWDAYRQAQPERRRGRLGIFVLVLALFFVLGWQIGEINPQKAVAELSDTWPPLKKILWPWKAAMEQESDVVSAQADILVPCDQEPPPLAPEEIAGEPYVVADPTCGDFTIQDKNLQTIPGTSLTFTGRGFPPNTETQIWWVDPIFSEFQVRWEGESVIVQTDDQGSFQVTFPIPYSMPSSSEVRQIHHVEARQISKGAWKPSGILETIIELMIETIFLGMMATIFGIVLAVPMSFLAARNMMSGSRTTVAIYYLVRTILNIIRSIEPLIWALIAMVWVGIGPFAGILALTVHSVAALGKLYSEAIEGIDPGPIEAIQATGATRLQIIMYAVVPQMIPAFVSFSIYRWDINVRMSTIIGMVGGGGIGFLLIQYIRLWDYRSAGIAVWFIAITVAILDFVSAEIRQRFV